MVQILADMQEPGKIAIRVAQGSAQNKAVENFCCPRQDNPGLNPVLRAVPGPTDTAAAQAKQRILERIEMVESADGAGNGQVAWRKALVRRRDAWAALSSNTIFNTGSFVTRHWHAWPCQDASCATDMTSILIKVMLDRDSVARTTPSSLWQFTTQLSFQPELLAHA